MFAVLGILDYGKAASQVGAMATDLSALLNSVNESMPQITLLGQQTKRDAQSVVDRAFHKGLVLILVLLAGSVSAALIYRVLAIKLAERRT